MGCDELHRLLETVWHNDERLSGRIAAHVRNCQCCHHGLVRLSEALLTNDELSCSQCLDLLPEYFEATHPVYPLLEMPAKEMAQVVFHLSHCVACQEAYEMLLALAEQEERDARIER
jgi:hypothetical protein